MKKIDRLSGRRQIVVILGTITVVLAVGVVALLMRPAKVVGDFEQCKKAGGALLEIYPEQCMINGMTFTNENQSIDIDDRNYIGMKEDDALREAQLSDTPARVVERDNEALPVTMDFVFGRHNFYVKNSKVYKVEIEGLAEDNGK